MCTLYDRIQELCQEKGVSGSRMCLDLGLSKSTLSDIKSGRKKGISTSTAQKFATYLGVSVGYLLGEDDIKKDLATVFDELLKKHGITGTKMCHDLNMSKSFMTELRKGRAKSIKIETAQKIASYFGITVDELYGIEAKNDQATVEGGLENKVSLDGLELTEGEIAFIRLLRRVPAEDKAVVIDKILSALDKQ